MARLPVPGSDDGTWGDVLNTYLSVGHKTDGTHLNVFNVKEFGAVGDGVTNDTASIQAAIDAAKVAGSTSDRLGGVVFFPPGSYSIRTPLILPRTGATPTNVVWLVGAETRSCQITGHSSFPTARALIEWDNSTATRAWDQHIENLTLVCPSVALTNAIWYKLNVQSSTLYATYDAERLQLDLINVWVEASNQYHDVAIRIEGSIWFSNWDNVWGNFNQNTITYDTLTVQFDSATDTSEGLSGTTEPGWTTDAPGFSYGRIKNLAGGGRRGGKSRTIKGRLLRSTIDTAFSNGGRAGSVMYDLINCIGNFFIGLGAEGLDEDAQYQLTNCHFNTFQAINLGSPDATGATGLKLINSSDNSFRDRLAFSSQSAFSANSSKVVNCDSQSNRNRFINFSLRVTSTVAAELTDAGTNNFFSGVYNATRTGGGTAYTQGTDPYTQSLPSQTGNSGKYLTTDGTTASWGAPSASVNNISTFHAAEDFVAGDTASGRIGTLGWGWLNGTAIIFLDAVANHPGIIQMATSAASGTISGLYTGATSNKRPILATDSFDITFVVRLNDADSRVRIGLSESPLSATPGDAAYFERLDTDTNWFRVARHSSIQTRTDTSIASTTSWVKLRIRRVDASTIGFTIDAASELTLTTNLPTTAQHVFCQITNASANNKTLDIDLIDISVTGLTR